MPYDGLARSPNKQGREAKEPAGGPRGHGHSRSTVAVPRLRELRRTHCLWRRGARSTEAAEALDATCNRLAAASRLPQVPTGWWQALGPRSRSAAKRPAGAWSPRAGGGLLL